MAWHHYQLVMLAQMALAERHSFDVQVRVIALCQRLGMGSAQVWAHIERLASGAR